MVARASSRVATALALFAAALVAGYLVSSRFGPDLLRDEAETQLSKLLRGRVSVERARLRVGFGLELLGDDIQVFYAEPMVRNPGGPSLWARRARARIDILSLLRGRFALRELAIDGLEGRIARSPEGRWSPPPIEALGDDDPPASGDLERYLGFYDAFEAVTRALLEKPTVARRVALRDASVTLVDGRPRGPGERPSILRIESINGHLEHDWIGDGALLDLRGSLVDERGTLIPLDISGHRREGGELRLALAATGLELDAFQDYTELWDPTAALAGTLSGVVAYESPARSHGALEIDWVAHGFRGEIHVGDLQLDLDTARARARARSELHPGRLRISELTLGGVRVGLQIEGLAERPLRDSSRTQMSFDLRGLGLDEVRRFVQWLPAADGAPLQRLLANVEGGAIEHIEGRGTERFSEWRKLLRGELQELPTAFVLGARIANIDLVGEAPDQLTELAAILEWSGDRIGFHEAHAKLGGSPLPILDLEVDGVSNLISAPAETRALRVAAGPVPGISTLLEVVLGAGDDDDDGEPGPGVRVEIDALDHPALVWPLDRAELVLSPEEDGLRIAVEKGLWAGAPIRGDGFWQAQPQARVHFSLEAHEPGPDGSPGRDPDAPPSWGNGRFALGELVMEGVPIESFAGEFALRESRLDLSSVGARVATSARVDGRASFDLGDERIVGVDLDAYLRGGDASALSPLIGLPDNLVTGSVHGSAGIGGALRPGKPLLAELVGRIELHARDGEVRQRIPLIVAVASATEGFNPFASRESIQYEAIDAELRLDGGLISTTDFALEGPMRVFATGSIDPLAEPPEIDAVVGIFLFRQADQILGKIPLVRGLVSDKGMMGAYFAVKGPLEDPNVDALAMNSIAEAIPDFVKAPFKVMRALRDALTGGR